MPLAPPPSPTAPRRRPGLATLAVRAGRAPDPSTGAILPSICQSTTFVHDAVGVHRGHTYSRASNPTVSVLEAALGELEDAPPAVCFATGMAAITALVLATCRAGDHVVLSEVVYGGTVRLLRQVLADLGVAATFVDTADPDAVAAAVARRPAKLVLVETPGNPTLRLTDIEAVARVARAAGTLLAVDNTFLTPVLLRPLDLGADVAVYSTTKYIEGHNATVGGSLVTRDAALADRFRFLRKTLGSIQAPFEAWLTLQGLKTLPLRLRQHSASAQRIAEWLEGHPVVERVLYPGLPSFPQAALARRLHPAGGHCGIIAFELRGGAPAGIAAMNAVRLCSLAENLGAAETLVTHPVSMTHGDVPADQRARVGITDGLIRLSVGLEDVEDLIDDLAAALDAAVGIASHPRTTDQKGAALCTAAN